MKSLGIIVVTVIGLCTASDDWSYWGDNGPLQWQGLCATGKKQSPINVITEDTVKVDMGALKFIRYELAYPAKVTNTGHSVKIQLEGVPTQLEGANLPNKYILEQMHFHWPTEHTIDDVFYSLELHLVHYSSLYNDTSMASQYDNGIAVVATLFEFSKEDNLDLMPIIEATKLVPEAVGKSTELTETKVVPFLLLPKDHTSYYHYNGSLTTPECQESVMWYIFVEKLPISWAQFKIFKNVSLHENSLNFNSRPTQPLWGRKVYHHGYSAATAIASNLSLTCLGILLSKLLHAK